MERRAVLYTGMRLDGSIADRAGGAGWMAGDGSQPGCEGSDPDFYRGVGAVVMGGHTCHQIAEELSPGRWPYPEKERFVLTRRPPAERGEATSVDGLPERLIERRRRKGDIWVCGGAELARRLAVADGIDRYHLSVLPSMLGEGLSLFGGLGVERPLRLVSAKRYNGIVDLVYERRGEAALL
ncbi:dihydrofolate reductase family protein [Bittarella massiliensis (ex Durand et al. 2017)]|uniref:dihydrofolate reductase family protein n=1 Tax=Bittarella massiliensis (ex Durand et al. 2017) TaxID=1720313 RepID=UPI00073EB61B|nr:dihydrofolate reductase family protein [Bittarella massiliensis (ex Durand et al. 2017)]